MSTVDVRRIGRRDVDEVYRTLTSEAPRRHRERLEAQERGGFVYLVAWLEDRPVGFVGAGSTTPRRRTCSVSPVGTRW